MKNMIFWLLFMGLVSCGGKDCADKGNAKVVNPNGDSELALWMREIFDIMMVRKNALKEGDHSVSLPIDAALKHAKATEPEKAQSELYQAMAQTYLSSIQVFNEAVSVDKKDKFNGIVDQCMGCHQQLCPGPMVKIKKLYLK